MTSNNLYHATAAVVFILCNRKILSTITTHTTPTHFYTEPSHEAESLRQIQGSLDVRTPVKNHLPDFYVIRTATRL